MYDLTLNIDSESTGLTYILPGINENIRLGKANGEYPIRYGVSKNNTEYLEFSFLNEEGQAFIHTEFLPVVRQEDPDYKAKLEKKTINQMKRVRHIATKIVSEDVLKFKAETFKEFCDTIIKIIGTNYINKLFRVKIVYNDRNYTTFPNYVPFIENMQDTPKEKSRLSMSNDDKVVKTKADNLSTRTNPNDIDIIHENSAEASRPSVANSEPATNNNDLPF